FRFFLLAQQPPGEKINVLLLSRVQPAMAGSRGSETIAKPRIEFGQCVRSVLLILNGKIFPVAAHLSAAHLERFRIAHVARMQDFRIKRTGGLQLLHVLESGKLERVLEHRHVGSGFAEHVKQVSEMFCRRGAECFISYESEIVAPGELIHPIVHRAYDGAYAEPSVAQHVAYILLPEFARSMRIAPRYLQVKRNETIARISREQNDLCPAKLPSRHQILAAKPIPEVAFGSMLEQIVRKYQPRNTRLAVTFRAQSKLKAEALAEVRTNKCTQPSAAALRNRNNDGRSSGKFSCTAAKVAPCPSRIGVPKSRARDGFIRNRKPRKRSGEALFVSGCLLRFGSGQRLRCYFDCHSGCSAERRGCCIRAQKAVFVQAQLFFGGALASTHRRKRRRHVEDGSLASLKTGPKK